LAAKISQLTDFSFEIFLGLMQIKKTKSRLRWTSI